MPLKIPTLDDRRYQDLLDEALARILVHNPEWTNFNKSDPGVTLIEIFAFLTESLLYRCNQIPERNRRKFLSLLGVPLRPASSALGLVTFANDRGPLTTLTLNADLEVKARETQFRTVQALDVLPVEAHAFFKRELPAPSGAVEAYYKQLYASFVGQPPTAQLQFYETMPFPRREGGVDLGRDTLDASLWIALAARPVDGGRLDDARRAIERKTLSLALVPEVIEAGRRLAPGSTPGPEAMPLLQYQIPKLPPGGMLPPARNARIAQYQALAASASTDVLAEPGVVQFALPGASELTLWRNLDPLEAGAGDFPPSLEDTDLADRVITWIRVRSTGAARARLLWAGINAVFVAQRAHVANEVLPDGTGEPDQVVTLSRRPVIPGSVRLTVITPEKSKEWHAIDDLLAAGPEVPVPDPAQPPGTRPPSPAPCRVFTVDPESGQLRFGDGTRGARPPFGAKLRADYDCGVGRAGNVGPRAINGGPALPPGLRVENPVATWGGADEEMVSEGEKQIASYLQHRDRLVNERDFETITRRTPGVEVGRVEVIAAFSPELGQNEPGDAPGAVTLVVIPRYDPAHPDAPVPDRRFLDAVCAYLEPRRLVTTEVFVRGPIYKPIWISVGIDVVAGAAVPEVREAVKHRLLRFLSPLPPDARGVPSSSPRQGADPSMSSSPGPARPAEMGDPAEDAISLFGAEPDEPGRDGWPLRKPVIALELLAQASRARGVRLVSQVLLAEGTKDATPQVPITGLELPQVAGISVVVGDPAPLTEFRGPAAPPTAQPGTMVVPVPVIAEECK